MIPDVSPAQQVRERAPKPPDLPFFVNDFHDFCILPPFRDLALTNSPSYTILFSADVDLSIEISGRLERGWACFGRYITEFYDRPGVRLRLELRLLKAEVITTTAYGCVTWSPQPVDYDRRRRVHHLMLLRCLGWREQKHDGHILSCARVLVKTVSESIDVTVRGPRKMFVSFTACMGEQRLPRRVLLGEMIGCKGYSFGQERS